MKKKIFVSAYACEPDKGSEIGVGWHWILAMSERFELWVMTRKSNQKNIEQWISAHPYYSKIHFVYYDLPSKYAKWKKGMKGVRRYYFLWQKMSNELVKQTMQENDIQCYHALTYGNALWSVSSYGMKQEFIWGPIGGLESVSANLLRNYSVKVRLIESVRRTVVACSKINIPLRKRCKKAKLILCKSEVVKRNLPKKYREKAVVFTDVATEVTSEYQFKKDEEVKFFAVGRLDGWRGFDLLLRAFRKATTVNKNISLEIAGDGIAYRDLKKIIGEENKNIKLLGQISKSDYQEKMDQCDVVVNPVLREGGVTTAFDAISKGKPVICIDTEGYTKSFSEQFSVVIERKTAEEIEEKIMDAILQMTDEGKREKMSRKAYEQSKEMQWEYKGHKVCELLEKML